MLGRLLVATVSLVLCAAPAAEAFVPETVLVSSSASGTGGTGDSRAPVVSADGRFVAFESDAPDLVPDDANGVADVFVKDLETGAIDLVSRAAGAGGAVGDQPSRQDSPFAPSQNLGASISADGRFVAFQSRATNLVPGDTNEASDVFVRDRQTQQTILVSVGMDGGPGRPGQGEPLAEGIHGLSAHPSISADGRYVAFDSHADNLVIGADPDVSNVFVRDLVANPTRVVTPAETTDGGAFVAISGDGGKVAYQDYPFAYVVDVGSLERVRLTGEDEVAAMVEISDDGEWVSFAAEPDSGEWGAYRIRSTGADRERLDVPHSDPQSPPDQRVGYHRRVGISADGRFGAFTSFATTLHPADGDTNSDVFVRDAAGDSTILVSRASGDDGAKATGSSEGGSLSEDGAVVVFDSSADNLADRDGTDTQDVFARIVAPLPPVNLGAPRIVAPGDATLGSELTCEPGRWKRADGFTYQWMRGLFPIGGETGPTYRLREEDAGRELTCIVTASHQGKTRSAPSDVYRWVPPPAAGRPVIFVPGFMASEIECTDVRGNRDNLWPDALPKFTEFGFMELAADGRSPAHPLLPCNRTARAGGNVVQSVLGLNIHGGTTAFLKHRFGDPALGGRGYVFPYDWRKSPGEAVPQLDAFIDRVRARHGAEQVAILTHSNGGLVTRWYIDDAARAAKVAAVADFGTPWWGTPKPWFTVAMGVEEPISKPGPDLLVPNAVLKSFMTNLTGIYYLFPSPSYYARGGPAHAGWLNLLGAAQRESGVQTWLGRWGGNAALLRQAAADHARYIDGFKRNGVDFRNFVGAGRPTLGFVQHLAVPPAPAAWAWETSRIGFTNGDGTVALISQRQGHSAAGRLGEQVPEYFFCGIGHMDEPETPHLQNKVAQFLELSTLAKPVDIPLDGEADVKGALTSEPCTYEFHKLDVLFALDAHRIDAAVTVELHAAAGGGRASAAQAGSGERMPLQEAARRGLVEIMRAGRRWVIVSATPKPLRVDIDAKRYVARTARILTDGKEAGQRAFAGRGRASFTLRPGTPATARRGGRVLKPQRADRRPPRTRVTVRRRGKRATLRFRARDASGVVATYVTLRGRPLTGRGIKVPGAVRGAVRVRVRDLPRVRFSSVDLWGNVERPRRVR